MWISVVAKPNFASKKIVGKLTCRIWAFGSCQISVLELVSSFFGTLIFDDQTHMAIWVHSYTYFLFAQQFACQIHKRMKHERNTKKNNRETHLMNQWKSKLTREDCGTYHRQNASLHATICFGGFSYCVLLGRFWVLSAIMNFCLFGNLRADTRRLTMLAGCAAFKKHLTRARIRVSTGQLETILVFWCV